MTATTGRDRRFLDEQARIRELIRAGDNFLAAVEADPALASRTRLAAAGLAAALQQVAADWPQLAREWRQLGRDCSDAQQQMRSMERQLAELYSVVEQDQEWPTLL
jgi:ABC-type branched-subunit amino acid transport system ATPase component